MAELVHQRTTINNPVLGATLRSRSSAGIAGGAVASPSPRSSRPAPTTRRRRPPSAEVAEVRPGVGGAVPPDVPDRRIAVARRRLQRNGRRAQMTSPAAAPSTMTRAAARPSPNTESTSLMTPATRSNAWAPATDRSGRLGRLRDASHGVRGDPSRATAKSDLGQRVEQPERQHQPEHHRSETGEQIRKSAEAQRRPDRADHSADRGHRGGRSISCPGAVPDRRHQVPGSGQASLPAAWSTISTRAVAIAAASTASPRPRASTRAPDATRSAASDRRGPGRSGTRGVAVRRIEVADERDEEALGVGPVGPVVGQDVHLVGHRPRLDEDRLGRRRRGSLARQRDGRLHEPGEGSGVPRGDRRGGGRGSQ